MYFSLQKYVAQILGYFLQGKKYVICNFTKICWAKFWAIFFQHRPVTLPATDLLMETQTDDGQRQQQQHDETDWKKKIENLKGAAK
jgi:hypothetical protein